MSDRVREYLWWRLEILGPLGRGAGDRIEEFEKVGRRCYALWNQLTYDERQQVHHVLLRPYHESRQVFADLTAEASLATVGSGPG